MLIQQCWETHSKLSFNLKKNDELIKEQINIMLLIKHYSWKAELMEKMEFQKKSKFYFFFLNFEITLKLWRKLKRNFLILHVDFVNYLYCSSNFIFQPVNLSQTSWLKFWHFFEANKWPLRWRCGCTYLILKK